MAKLVNTATNISEIYADTLNAALADNANVVTCANSVSGAPAATANGTITLGKNIAGANKSVFRFGVGAGHLDLGDVYDLGANVSAIVVQVSKKNAGGEMAFWGKSETVALAGKYAGLVSASNNIAGNYFTGDPAAGNNYLTGAENPNAPNADAEFILRVWEIIRAAGGGCKLRLWKNKVLIAEKSFADDLAAYDHPYSYKIGRYGLNGALDNIFQGDIAYHGIFNKTGGALSPADWDYLHNKLGAYYNLSYAWVDPDAAAAGDTTPPVFGSFTNPSNTPTSVNLAWSYTDNVAVTGYDLDSSPNGSTGWTPLLANVNQTGYTHSGLAPATTYFYRLRARDAAGNVTGYAPGQATTPPADTQAPTVPGTPTFASIGQAGYTVNWTASTDNAAVAGYDLIKSATSDFSSGNTTYNLGNVTTYPATGLSPSTIYYWKVLARDAAGNTSAYSTSASQATTAGGSAPTASFTKSAASGTAPLTVNFTDTSTNTPTSWAWNFGDGTTSTSQNQNHTFSNAGTFTVSLTATNAYGSNSTSQTVVVSSASGVFTYNEFSIPERYFKPAPDWAKVTRSHEYEDGGMTFNELNTTAPQTWQLEYTGLDVSIAALFDAHFNTYRFSKPFTFVGKKGTFTNCYYKEYEPNHDRNKSWIQARRMTIIKYP